MHKLLLSLLILFIFLYPDCPFPRAERHHLLLLQASNFPRRHRQSPDLIRPPSTLVFMASCNDDVRCAGRALHQTVPVNVDRIKMTPGREELTENAGGRSMCGKGRRGEQKNSDLFVLGGKKIAVVLRVKWPITKPSPGNIKAFRRRMVQHSNRLLGAITLSLAASTGRVRDQDQPVWTLASREPASTFIIPSQLLRRYFVDLWGFFLCFLRFSALRSLALIG